MAGMDIVAVVLLAGVAGAAAYFSNIFCDQGFGFKCNFTAQQKQLFPAVNFPKSVSGTPAQQSQQLFSPGKSLFNNNLTVA